MRRRWLRRALIALPVVLLTLLVGACGSVMYLNGIWERANHECGRRAPTPATGWSITFDGKEDTFLCTYRHRGARPVARLRPEEFMGSSGSWPIFADLVAYELEAIDGDAP